MLEESMDKNIISTPMPSKSLLYQLLTNERWRDTKVTALVQKNIPVVYASDMGIVDFQPSSNVVVLYLTELTIVMEPSLRRKLVKLRKCEKAQGVVIYERTPITVQHYSKLQKFAVLELGLVMHPIASEEECAQLLYQLVVTESRVNFNPFQQRSRAPPLQTQLLSTVLCVPSLGQVNAKALLQHFHTIEAIVNASVADLTPIIGPSRAQNVHDFFHKKVS